MHGLAWSPGALPVGPQLRRRRDPRGHGERGEVRAWEGPRPWRQCALESAAGVESMSLSHGKQMKMMKVVEFKVWEVHEPTQAEDAKKSSTVDELPGKDWQRGVCGKMGRTIRLKRTSCWAMERRRCRGRSQVKHDRSRVLFFAGSLDDHGLCRCGKCTRPLDAAALEAKRFQCSRCEGFLGAEFWWCLAGKGTANRWEQAAGGRWDGAAWDSWETRGWEGWEWRQDRGRGQW